jgi:hypothetical protein
VPFSYLDAQQSDRKLILAYLDAIGALRHVAQHPGSTPMRSYTNSIQERWHASPRPSLDHSRVLGGRADAKVLSHVGTIASERIAVFLRNRRDSGPSGR